MKRIISIFLTAVMGVTMFSVVPLANENVPKSLEDFLSELTDMVEDYDTSVFNLQGSGITKTVSLFLNRVDTNTNGVPYALAWW